MTRTTTLIALLVLLAAPGCWQKMYETPRYEEYEPSTFFRDSTSARPLVEGTVSRAGRQYEDQAPLFAEEGNAASETALPFPATMEVLERGQQQYEIYCAPCHSRTGDGDGMIVQRGFQPPPSFHTDRLREAPLQHVYNVITNGYGAMYSYAGRVSPEDRWAIAAYIRALQYSQNAPLDEVPPDIRRELGIVQP